MLATMTTKGQVTVPKPIRDKLRLKPGDRIEFLLDENGARITPVKAPVTALKGMLAKPASPVTLAEMDEAIARAGRDRP
ncbi:AbrB/MazE/SpoVT family DNA-binding domain-containing protein [Candidatus Rariloculus sp.]|uniref:AbrB/MazE/SpoVT family DNA-binding domain-containing protein n=1 Tax=Candidatus Rariloculus sp. TaxID=3101265 RepID=UPI003D148119